MQDIIMTCCRDEVDVIETFVNFYLKMGFDHIYISDNGSTDIPTPAVVTDHNAHDLPLFFRYRRSEGSRGAFVVDRESLLQVVRERTDGVLTRFVEGREATVDAYRDLSGRIVSIVPRTRRRSSNQAEITWGLAMSRYDREFYYKAEPTADQVLVKEEQP